MKVPPEATSIDHLAHPYADIAHRAALPYAFATVLMTALVGLSAWPQWVNLTAATILIFFFLTAIVTYAVHCYRRDTTNQFNHHPTAGLQTGMIALTLGEVGSFTVLPSGFIAARL